MLLGKEPENARHQEKQLEDTEKADKFRVYGEPSIRTGHSAPEKAKEITVRQLLHGGGSWQSPLDPRYSAMKNASARYFARYDKLKRTRENVTGAD